MVLECNSNLDKEEEFKIWVEDNQGVLRPTCYMSVWL